MCKMCGKIEKVNNCIDIWERGNVNTFFNYRKLFDKKRRIKDEICHFMAHKTIAIENTLEPK